MKKIFNVEGMHCASCAMLIEMELEDGGINASCDYVKESLEVEIKSSDQEKKIIEIVKKAGYQLN